MPGGDSGTVLLVSLARMPSGRENGDLARCRRAIGNVVGMRIYE